MYLKKVFLTCVIRIFAIEMLVRNDYLRMTMMVLRIMIVKMLMMMKMIIMTMPVKHRHLMLKVFMVGIKLMLWLEHLLTYVA